MLSYISKIIVFKTTNGSLQTGRCISEVCNDFGGIMYLKVEVDGKILTRTYNVYSDQITEIRNKL